MSDAPGTTATHGDAVIAAYANGEAVESIAARFDLTMAEIESLIADETAMLPASSLAPRHAATEINQTPPGWYADPSDASAMRWWDGRQWADFVRPTSPAQLPSPTATSESTTRSATTKTQLNLVPPPRISGSLPLLGEKTRGRPRYLLVSLLATLLTIVGAAGSFVYREHEKDVDRPARAKAAALAACHRTLGYSLKAPATAQYSDETLMFGNSKPDSFMVFGAVDAENSYGALVRNGYICGGILTADQEDVKFGVQAEVNDKAAAEGVWDMRDEMGEYQNRWPTCGLNYLSACFD
ncbi:DUF2510 domain-containing protein [Actinoplanes sp. NPDC049596]|uniref:DUF2510 domain-containing protein n=1 Tax=unclassified Actinoplanes TaxID=2626549 RepID=UPI00343787C8